MDHFRVQIAAEAARDYAILSARPSKFVAKSTRTLETDFLVYTRGNLFCVEIKNYKGRISYAPKYRTVQVEQRGIFGSRYVPQTVIDSYDDSRILQEKVGNYGEGIFTKEYPHPLKKTRYFLHRLKDYLSTRDARFQRLHIIPVVGFAEHADISAIHSFETGMIYVSDIPTFFPLRSHPFHLAAAHRLFLRSRPDDRAVHQRQHPGLSQCWRRNPSAARRRTTGPSTAQCEQNRRGSSE